MRPIILSALLMAAPLVAQADVDVVFVLDTTGSMSGELREAKDRVRQLAEALAESRPNERVRLGVVAYRDRGDAYVTRVHALTTDVDATFKQLSSLTAAGGGDTPEDALAGLEAAIDGAGWDLAPGVERQLFLIGDAPPHLDYRDGPRPEALYARARERGIVINAIGCRSLDVLGVAAFREAAYATEGRYQHIGRVTAERPALAAAMLDTLARSDVDAERERAPEVAAVERPPVIDATHLGGPRLGLELRYLSRGADGSCRVELRTPEGVALAAPPRVRLGRSALFVDLRLGAGASERRHFEIPRCASGERPIRLGLEG